MKEAFSRFWSRIKAAHLSRFDVWVMVMFYGVFSLLCFDSKAKVYDELIELKKKQQGVFITIKVLNALKKFFLGGRRAWKCEALRGLFIVDRLGRVADCHLRQPVVSIFELPEL